MTTLTTSLPRLTVTPRLRFSGTARAEFRKLTSLTSVRLAFLITIAAGVVGALLQADGRSDATSALLGSIIFSGVVIGVIGAVAGSSEYATGTIQPSLMAAPRRLSLLAAKAAVMALVGGVLALVSGGAGLVAARSTLAPEVALPLIACAVSGAILGAFAAMFSMAVRNSSASITGVLAFSILLPGLGGGIRIGSFWLADLLPSEATGTLVVGGSAGALVGAVVVLLTWLVAASVAAVVRFVRFDA